MKTGAADYLKDIDDIYHNYYGNTGNKYYLRDKWNEEKFLKKIETEREDVIDKLQFENIDLKAKVRELETQIGALKEVIKQLKIERDEARERQKVNLVGI